MKYLLMAAALLTMAACGNQGQKEKATVTATQPTAAAGGDTRSIDAMEAIFQNDNWLVIQGKDSSYLYCSRLGTSFVKTYYFRMERGDSVQTTIDTLHYKGNAIGWTLPFNKTPVQLVAADSNKMVFKNVSGSEAYEFNKKSNQEIVVKMPDGSNLQMLKTPPLSSFLVRSKYDYMHGTRLAFKFD
ncbi:MAG TPA: hypothetical protein VL307_17765 [Chitinophagaceae bacterium]|nr:hypothetical protein [Chitinophagaceae bacterium]